ncbi:MAG TPA: flagellar protein [Alcanivorax sp.]|jgi:flagellar protein FlaG|nr:flagellar protein FlaG [Alcanivorax sp.]SMO50271.1 flagellar protein FlaG [Alcanivorax sp. DSM 26295]HBM23372.1 flagellar protein [Alcanivorax sp.]|tara:strand:- start:19320 stop:19688 length:369 start_codon:yes stop_codon:yes gene_type:complete
MTTPVDNNSVSSLPSQFSYLAARQRVEKVLAQLPAAGGAVQESDSEGRMVEREELVKPVQQINEVLRRYGVEFQLSEDSGRTIIRLIDRENGELIRQIPPEEALNAAQRLEEMKGRLLNLEA